VRNVRSYERWTGTRGSTTAYTLWRLKREHPDFYDMVIAGKLSAHAAAIQSGMRKARVGVPSIEVRRWWRKLSDTEREEFKREIAT
jgi:hypothetical protein